MSIYNIPIINLTEKSEIILILKVFISYFFDDYFTDHFKWNCLRGLGIKSLGFKLRLDFYVKT